METSIGKGKFSHCVVRSANHGLCRVLQTNAEFFFPNLTLASGLPCVRKLMNLMLIDETGESVTVWTGEGAATGLGLRVRSLRGGMQAVLERAARRVGRRDRGRRSDLLRLRPRCRWGYPGRRVLP